MIENWPEISKTGFDGLQLGDDIREIRHRFGDSDTFRRGQGASESDHFVDLGIIVTYDDGGSITFIEIGRPSDPTLQGVKLLDRPEEEVLAELQSIDIWSRSPRRVGEEGPALKGLGIGLWVPMKTVEAVSIGEDESD